ncbi:MAG: CDP-diacylglycerol--glycerol-3-phosphate 3-phosphatidyltransferase [Holosporales bacterium]
MTYLTASNLVTGLRIIVAPFLYLAIVDQQWLVALCLCLFGSMTDFLDGYLARRFHQTSTFGERFDPFADKIMMTAVYFGLYHVSAIPAFLLFAVIGRDIFLIFGSLYIMLKKINIPLHPLRLSKINTGLQLFLCAWIVTIKALGNFDQLTIPTQFFIYLTTLTTLLSGFQYSKRIME